MLTQAQLDWIKNYIEEKMSGKDEVTLWIETVEQGSSGYEQLFYGHKQALLDSTLDGEYFFFNHDESIELTGKFRPVKVNASGITSIAIDIAPAGYWSPAIEEMKRTVQDVVIRDNMDIIYLTAEDASMTFLTPSFIPERNSDNSPFLFLDGED